MSRPTCLHIHLDRLIHNLRIARNLHDGRLVAVVKANAYGHGDVACVQALASLTEGFAVATLEEALRLRHSGVTGRLLLLEGCFEPSEMEEVVRHDLTPVIHDPWQIDALKVYPFSVPIPVWLKVDTGMHRLGFQPDQARDAFETLMASGKVSDITVMTHFANADSDDPRLLEEPMRRFRQATRHLSALTSLCNSGALLGHPQVRGDWARPGLMLYGVDPAPHQPARQPLKPVMRLVSAISAIRTIAPGETVGYGSLFRAERTTRVGVVPCGYADGYPRSARQGTPVWVEGVEAPLIGCVSMDMLTVDLTGCPHASPGTPVELWGDRIPVTTVARQADTIAYELLCHARRASRVIHPAGSPS